MNQTYPKAKEEELFIFRGKTLDDPYQWMRDGDDPKLRSWVAAENAYTDAFFRQHQSVYQTYCKRNSQKKDLPSYTNITKSPNGYVMTRQIADRYEIIETDDDFHEMRSFAKLLETMEHTTFFSGAICPNDENIAVFHGLSDGYDRPSLFVFDLTKEALLYRADGVFTYQFDPHGKRLLYGDAKADVAHKTTHNDLKRYDVETNRETTLYAYEKNAIMIEPHAWAFSEEIVGVIEADYSHNVIVFGTAHGWKFYRQDPQCVSYVGQTSSGHILCSYIKKPYGEIIAYDPKTQKESVLFAKEGIFIKEACCVNEAIYILATKDVSSVAFVIQNNTCEEIALPPMCSATFAGKDEQRAFVTIESFILPPQLYALANSACQSVFAPMESDEAICVKQVFYPSTQDHEMIPAYLIYRKDTAINGSLPTLMYGYGGYNIAMPPTYHNPFCGLDIVDWVNDGGLYVHCCLRGGNEYGEAWHTAGYMQNKKNCFYDFIGIAEGIIKDGYTAAGHIAINGGSNGGLLMCALLTMRPDLWGCVVASVPHTDMISFVHDDRGPMYITEYGDPHDEEQFAYFLTYSPFHNVKKIAYPPVYIQTGECDNNVPPYHGKKMAARLQQYNTSDHPILLRVLAKGSHDRGKGETYIQTISEMQTFMALALKKEI